MSLLFATAVVVGSDAAVEAALSGLGSASVISASSVCATAGFVARRATVGVEAEGVRQRNPRRYR